MPDGMANMAQAEELRRKTFLPYKQGVLGCLRFPSLAASMQGQVACSSQAATMLTNPQR